MPIGKSKHYDLVVGAGEGLTSFFVPGDIDRAFRENEFAVSEMIEILTDIARAKDMRVIQRKDGTQIEEPITSPRERLVALKMLDQKAKEAMVLGGLIQSERLQLKKVASDGTTAEYNAEGMRLIQEGSSRLKSTLAILEGASCSKSDEIIDMEEEDGPKNDGGDGPRLQSRPVSGGKPKRSDQDSGRGGTGSGGRPRSTGSGGDGVCGELHGPERAGSPESQSVRGTDDDQVTTGGAKNERETRVPVESGRSDTGEIPGGASKRDVERDQRDPSTPPKRPVIPGEHAAARRNWWEPGTPRREPDSNPGTIRDCKTAESSLDQLKRIERARQHAHDAQAGYIERREKSQRAADLKPGDEPRSCD